MKRLSNASARYVLNATILFAVGVAIWLGYRRFFGTTGAPAIAPQVWEIALDAQKRAAPFRAAPLASSEDVSAVIDTLLNALPRELLTDEPTRFASRDDLREPLSLVLDYLRVRSAGDALAYSRWAKSEGLHLTDSISDATMLTPLDLSALYSGAVGRTLPKDISPEQFFNEVYTANSAVSGGALRPVAVVTDAPAIEAMFSRVRSFQDLAFIAPTLGHMREDSLGDDFWVGASSIFGRRLWRSDRSVEYLAQGRSGGARAVLIRLLVEGASGLRVPMTFVLLYDDVAAVWRMEAIWLNNIGADPKRKLMSREPFLYVF